jgi:hypothetical protein
MTIIIDRDAIDLRLDHGRLWTKGWGAPADPTEPTCLHGAVRYCAPQPGDAHLIEQVGARYGWGTGDNDRSTDWPTLFARVPAEITDDMLAATFGPQWEQIVAFVRRAATLTGNETRQLAAARDAAWDAALAAARDAALATWDAALALSTRDLIGRHGYTQEYYDLLTRPWRTTIGPPHPEDGGQ